MRETTVKNVKSNPTQPKSYWQHPLVLMLTVFYLVSRYLRAMVLQSGFGFTSHCKHQPSCGENLFIQVKNQGIGKGSIVALKQLAGCY